MSGGIREVTGRCGKRGTFTKKATVERQMLQRRLRWDEVRLTIRKPVSRWKLQRVSTHPGEILLEEFLIPLGITQNALALKIRVPATRIGDIVHGKRAITPDTALRLARFFGNSPEFWLNLQQMHDLSKARLELKKTIERDVEAYVGA
jgi:addiction module HigA family antidote